MDQREELCRLAAAPGANLRELARRFNISRTTLYKWVAREAEKGRAGLEDRSRRPVRQPLRTPPDVEQAVLRVFDETRWGNRMIRAYLVNHSHPAVPSASTIQSILRRHGRLVLRSHSTHEPYVRFERHQPNSLWQMDFKGHFAMASGRCHPLTILDDHSRYSLGLQACADERGTTVQERLTRVFQRYGMPEQMLMDNGPPWGVDDAHGYTPLTVWLIRLGITPIHGRPYHPQTQGKDERFHRTLNTEVIRNRIFSGLTAVQHDFDRWRHLYNHERPHEALGLKPPISRYRPSAISFPSKLPPIDYGPTDEVLVPMRNMGRITFAGREWKIGKSFAGLPVAVRPTSTDGLYGVFFCHMQLREIDLRPRPEQLD